MQTRELEALGRAPRLDFIQGPTPIQRLDRLEQVLGEGLNGVRLFAKRDDFMALGGGGNKLRKLEFLLGDARAQGCDTFITVGGIQSNHARLSAAASARAGLACELVLNRQVPRTDEEYRRNGNVLLDGLFGATVHELPGDEDPLAFARERAAQLEREGRRPYAVGSGGSSPTGCLGYAACAYEIARQEERIAGGFARVVLPNASSGTHAGLAAGFTALGRDPGILRAFTTSAPAEQARRQTLDIARATLALLRPDPDASLALEAIDVAPDQLGDGYGIPTAAMFEAVRLLARTEGLLLDPVYGGKAFAGLLADVRAGAYPTGAAVLFLMTGGTPGLFAYRPAFDDQPERAGSTRVNERLP